MNTSNVSTKTFLTIKLLVITDAAQLYQLIDQSRMQLTNLVWSQSATLESTITFLENKLASSDKVHGIFQNKKLVGVLELRKKEDMFELGYWVGTKYRGRGIMKTAVKQLVDHQVKYHAIIAHIRQSNEASLKVLTNAGLKYDHTEMWQGEPWIHLKIDKD